MLKSTRPFLSILVVQTMISGLLFYPTPAKAQATPGTVTPIQHVVVIFQENISFDHYFGTYPNALNPQGEPAFKAAAGTPSVNGLSGALLSNNPNLNTANGAGTTNPFRLDRSQAATTDRNHNYTPEQMALHSGLVDLYPSAVGTAGSTTRVYGIIPHPILASTGITMGYFDGNTVTALWNYAQHYAMSDNSYDTSFGPSTPGALNLVSGQLNGVTGNINGTSAVTDGSGGSLSDTRGVRRGDGGEWQDVPVSRG